MCSNFSRRGKRVEKFEGEERDLRGFCTELSFENSSLSLLFLGQKKRDRIVVSHKVSPPFAR